VLKNWINGFIEEDLEARVVLKDQTNSFDPQVLERLCRANGKRPSRSVEQESAGTVLLCRSPSLR
jgi:hypothetical protein